jgi:hypothetical protein
VESESAELLMERIEIRRVMRAGGEEVVSMEAVDALGEPMGVFEAMNLLEFSKVQLMTDMVRSLIFDEEEDEDED